MKLFLKIFGVAVAILVALAIIGGIVKQNEIETGTGIGAIPSGEATHVDVKASKIKYVLVRTSSDVEPLGKYGLETPSATSSKWKVIVRDTPYEYETIAEANAELETKFNLRIERRVGALPRGIRTVWGWFSGLFEGLF